jgi:DNA polymerase-1
MSRDCIYIIDTFSLMFQVFHAIPPMTGTQGQPTNAVFGFTRDIFAIRDRKPKYLVCAFDSPGPGKRDEIYEKYKANRAEMPEDLRPQIPLIKQLLEGFRIPVLEMAGWEADDVIATVTAQATAKDLDVVIVSSDKDARQLLSPQVRMLNCRKNTFLDEAGLMEDWGVRPDQVVDFQSLVGDSVDNVPGVPKVGPKTARTLIEQFGTLDNVLANADKAPGKKLAENLVTYADQARLSRELVRLRTDLPMTVDFESATICDPDFQALYDLFSVLGFRRYATEMREKLVLEPDDAANIRLAPSGGPRAKAGESNAADSSGKKTTRQKSLMLSDEASLSGEPHAAATAGATALVAAEPNEKITVNTPASLSTELKSFESLDSVFVELMTSGHGVRQKRLTGAGLSSTTRTILVDLSGKESAEATELLLKWISAFPGRVVISSAKPLCHLLLSAGLPLPVRLFDASIADYLLDAGARTHELAEIVDRHATESVKKAAIADSRKGRQRTMFEDDDVAESPADPFQESANRCERQLRLLTAVAKGLQEGLQEDGLASLHDALESPLIRVLAKMEFAGISVDVPELKRQSDLAAIEIDRLTAEIYAMAGRTFNIDSPKQLSTVLFTDLKLPVIRKTQTGASTDQEVLEELAHQHPLPAKIMERRHLIKLKGTYLDALPVLVNDQTGRIHATFHQTVAATGRLSSSDPNLQNIPIRTPEGRQVRRAFRAGDPDWVLVCADYSQIELRVLAHFSGDEAMREAFRQGIDIHSAVASEVFGVPVEAVNSDLRRIAKAVNFGVIYGQTPWGLAAALGIGKDEAAQFIDNYFAKYSGVASFCEQVLTDTVRTGYARTILNRRRAITGIRRTTGINRNMPERTAINTVIQGSAADLIKQAMLDVDSALASSTLRATLLLQIHDELVFECHRDDAAALIPMIREKMQNAMTLDVPLDVDVTIGPNWLDQEDVVPADTSSLTA